VGLTLLTAASPDARRAVSTLCIAKRRSGSSANGEVLPAYANLRGEACVREDRG
jgi:hypothetical protein